MTSLGFVIIGLLLVIAIIVWFAANNESVKRFAFVLSLIAALGSLILGVVNLNDIIPIPPTPTNTPTPADTPTLNPLTTIPNSISIHEGCYHLGDDIDPNFCPTAPQANPFEGKFQIDQIRGSAYLQLAVKNVDPNEIREPIRIYVNGSFVDYLNRYVTEESDDKEVEIPVQKAILHIGENNILIFSAPYVNTSEKGSDDFEFRNLRIVFK